MNKDKYILIPLIIFIIIISGCASSNNNLDETTTNQTSTEKYIAEEFREISNIPYTLNEKVFSTDKLDWTHVDFMDIDDDTYYFTGDNGENWTYGIADGVKREIKQFYALDNSYDIFIHKVHNGRLIIGRGKWEGSRTCRYELVDITGGKENILFSIVSQGYPTASLVDGYAVINYSEQIEGTKHISKIVQINLDTKAEKTIWESEYLSDGVNYTGTFVPDIRGWKDGVCFQKVFMNNEYVYEDKSGTCTLSYYSFETEEIEELTEYSHKISYICGNKEIMLVSDYTFDIIDKSQGHFLLYEDGRYNTYDIPGTESPAEVIDSFILSDGVYLLHNDHDFYIYNMNDKTYYKERYNTSYAPDITIEPEDLPVFGLVYADGNRFAYSKSENGVLTIYEYMPN